MEIIFRGCLIQWLLATIHHFTEQYFPFPCLSIHESQKGGHHLPPSPFPSQINPLPIHQNGCRLYATAMTDNTCLAKTYAPCDVMGSCLLLTDAFLTPLLPRADGQQDGVTERNIRGRVQWWTGNRGGGGSCVVCVSLLLLPLSFSHSSKNVS